MASEVPLALQDCVVTNIRVEHEITKGANAAIRAAKWEGLSVVLKSILDTSRDGEKLRKTFFEECAVSNRLRHPNIVPFLGIHFSAGSTLPDIVLERMHCNLNDLLEENAASLSLEIQLRIIHGIGLGLRYLHTRKPSVIHKDLTSKNVLVSEGLEVKIADLCAARLTNCITTMDFMPPEVYNNHDPWPVIGMEVDIFSFGCIMIHIFSHQWPTPSSNMISSNDPSGKIVADSSSEIERRSQYLSKVPKPVEDVIVPLIMTCLENVPVDRPTAEEVCNQLETLVVNRQSTLPDNLLEAQLRLQELLLQVGSQAEVIGTKGIELHSKTSEVTSQQVEIQLLRMENIVLKHKVSELEVFADLPPRQVSKSSVKFYSSIELQWEQCASLPLKCFVTSVTRLDGNAYIAFKDSQCSYLNPLMYVANENRWVELPPLPYGRFSLSTIPNKKELLAIGGSRRKEGGSEISSEVYLWEKEQKKWSKVYPNMPTARCCTSSAGFRSTVIVAGGVTCVNPFTITRAVEVLHVDEDDPSDSYWSVVERLPHVVFEAVPLITNEKIYITAGDDKSKGGSICSAICASLPELLQSNNNSVVSQVWTKLPDMPYCSFAINHYQGHLITFTGDCMVEQAEEDNAVCKLVPLIHLLNPDTNNWDHVGSVTHGYYLGRSVHLSENKILFIGGLTGKHFLGNSNDLVSACLILTIENTAK